jgi:hypothetical protein
MAWRVIAGLRDLGDANVPDADDNIGGSRSHTRLPAEITEIAQRRTEVDQARSELAVARVNFA